MKDYIKIIRPGNLIFTAAIVAMFYYMVLTPIVAQYGVSIPSSTLVFILLEISSVFMAAGGYVVNDYFDTKIDEINKPEKVIVGKSMTRNHAARYFQVLFGVAILSGIYLAYLANDLTLALLFIVVAGLLWFYSSSYKRRFLIGNFIIALCAFLLLFIPGYTVSALLTNEYSDLIYRTTLLIDI